MNTHDFSDLRAEFEQFVRDKCDTGSCETNPEGEEENEFVPIFVEELAGKVLSPHECGAYLSRLDIKRIAEAVEESLPIKERKRMIKALFRHTTKKEFLRKVFDEFNRHLGGRVLIYRELAEAFPASKVIFDGYISKIEKTQKSFDQIVEDFEEIEPTFEPMMV